MLSPTIDDIQQVPLIHEIHLDERHLLNTLDGEWFEILHHFPWQDYRQFGADYYNALYDFNQASAQATVDEEVNPETKEEARERLLFDRTTAPIPKSPPAPILYQGTVVDTQSRDVTAGDVAPGVVPLRLAGRKPKCFFGLLKAFIGTSLMGFPAEPEKV